MNLSRRDQPFPVMPHFVDLVCNFQVVRSSSSAPASFFLTNLDASKLVRPLLELCSRPLHLSGPTHSVPYVYESVH